MDSIKRAVAETAVRAATKAVLDAQTGALDGAEVEVHKVKDLEVVIRVKLRVGGTRYFTFKVSEMA